MVAGTTALKQEAGDIVDKVVLILMMIRNQKSAPVEQSHKLAVKLDYRFSKGDFITEFYVKVFLCLKATGSG